MADGGQSGSGRPSWPVIFAGAIGAVAGMALAWLALDLAGLDGFWPGVIGTGLGAGIGVFLGQLAGSRLSRRPPGKGPPA